MRHSNLKRGTQNLNRGTQNLNWVLGAKVDICVSQICVAQIGVLTIWVLGLLQYVAGNRRVEFLMLKWCYQK